MPRFRSRHPPDGEPRSDLAVFLLQGREMIDRLARVHRQRWGAGAGARWDIYQTSGLITWTFADKVVTSPVQFLGSHAGGDSGQWLWAWANPTVLPALRVGVGAVRAYGEQHHEPSLTTARLAVDEDGALDLAAIALRITRATGFCRCPGVPTTFVTFGDVTIAHSNGRTETLRIDVTS